MTFYKIASIYDRINNLEAYDLWLDFVLASLPGPVEKALDVACGTGVLTGLMSPFVTSMTGLDIDSKMIEEAQKKHLNQENLSFVQGDMLNLAPYYNSYDLVTCFLDSINFLSSSDQVTQALGELVACLKPGGLLLFDVWTPWQIEEGFKEFEYSDVASDYGFIWKSYPKPGPSVSHQLTVFSHTQDDLYQRIDCQLAEYGYELDLFKNALDQTNLDSYEVLVDWGEDLYESQTNSKTQRWFFRCWRGE